MAKTGKEFKLPKPLFGFAFWQLFAENIKNKYKHHIFNKGNPKDVYNNKFKQYSQGYKKAKSSGKITINGQKTSVSGGYENSVAPVLRGDLQLDTNAEADPKDNAVYIGWTTHAKKVDWLRRNGRVLTDKNKAMPDPVMKAIMPEFNKELKKVMPKGSQTITIGKK
jgi:hypothetical protein